MGRVPATMRPNGPMKLFACLLRLLSTVLLLLLFLKKNLVIIKAIKSTLPIQNVVSDQNLHFSTMLRMWTSVPSCHGLPDSKLLSLTNVLSIRVPILIQHIPVTDCTCRLFLSPFKKRLQNCQTKLNNLDRRSRYLFHLHQLLTVIQWLHSKELFFFPLEIKQ